MRMLFCSRPSYGHLFPLMPLAEAARAAGHRVEFATGPSFAAKLARLGFPVHPVGVSIDEAAVALLTREGLVEFPRDEVGRPDLHFGARLFGDVLARRTVAGLLPVLTDTAFDVVVYEQNDFGAGIAAGLAGVPAVLHAISPQWPEPLVREQLHPHLDRIWAEHGRTEAPFDAALGEVFLDIVPRTLQLPWFVEHPARVEVRPVPWCEPGTPRPPVPEPRLRPLVYVTLGTVVANDEALRPVVEGVAGLDVDVLVALGAADGAGLGAVPANVRVEPFVDQARLLPAVDLVVHHGGSGTVLGALAHGKAQLVLPKGADQFLNGDRIAAAGLAEVIEPADVTTDAVATAAKIALAEPRPAVAEVQAQIAAMPAPDRVIDDLAEWVRAAPVR